MIRLATTLLFSTLAWGAWAQGQDYTRIADLYEMVAASVVTNTEASGVLPASASVATDSTDAPLYDFSVLVKARPQSFAPEDFQPLIRLGEKANRITQIYINGGTGQAGSYEVMQNQARYQDDISKSSVFAIYALGNVAQGLSAFISQLPDEDQKQPKRMRGKVIVNSSIFQQFAAISSMAVVEGMSEQNRIAMLDALAANLPAFSPIITDATLSDIYSNFRIRLLQLPNESGVKKKLAELQQQVASMRDDTGREEILTN